MRAASGPSPRFRLLAGAAAALLAIPVLLLGAVPAAADEPGGSEFRVLVFSKTAGFRHASIPSGIDAVQQLGADTGFQVDATEDAELFTDAVLAEYDAVIWLSTTGDVLNEAQQAAFERYIQGGGGFVGVHAAVDAEYDWPWYGELVGAYFDSHPPGTPLADVIVEDAAHPSTTYLPAVWTRTDEWMSFTPNPRDRVHVLLSLDESSYSPGATAMGDHPIAWCQAYDGGRS